MNYEQKYLKYKLKYLDLLSKQKAGEPVYCTGIKTKGACNAKQGECYWSTYGDPKGYCRFK
jgi:hypothetical protein